MPTTLYAVPGKDMGVVEIQSNNAKEMEVVEIQSNDSAYNVAPQRLANPVITSSISGLDGGQQLQDGEKKKTRLQKFIHCETQRNPIPNRNCTNRSIPTQPNRT
jgi:hypothetical protein